MRLIDLHLKLEQLSALLETRRRLKKSPEWSVSEKMRKNAQARLDALEAEIKEIGNLEIKIG